MERDPSLFLDVPPGFNDSDAESQVHPVARRLFSGVTPAEVFGKASAWVDQHSVFLIDVSWTFAHDEPEPCTLGVYFMFDPAPDSPETTQAQPQE